MLKRMKMRPTTHPVLTRELRLGWARAVRADSGSHSDARIRRACLIFLSEGGAKDWCDRRWATEMLVTMLPKDDESA